MYPGAELYFLRHESRSKLNAVAKKFTPYLPTPEFLKQFADRTNELEKELSRMKVDKHKLKPKESQTLVEIQVFLNQFMVEVYDIDFYGGDWMLGPNIFCMGVICKLEHQVRRYLDYYQLRIEENILEVMKVFENYIDTFTQYKRNMQREY